jgi:hypothetical protein
LDVNGERGRKKQGTRNKGTNKKSKLKTQKSKFIGVADATEIHEQEIARVNELANAYYVYNRLLIERGDFDFGDLSAIRLNYSRNGRIF